MTKLKTTIASGNYYILLFRRHRVQRTLLKHIYKIKTKKTTPEKPPVQWIWSESKVQNVSHLFLLVATSSYIHLDKFKVLKIHVI